MADDGTGTVTPPNGEASGAVTSREATRKKPSQGKFRSGVADQRAMTRIDTNRHGIRRETTIKPNSGKRTGPKKV